jgi:hypothetical protein
MGWSMSECLESCAVLPETFYGWKGEVELALVAVWMPLRALFGSQ